MKNNFGFTYIELVVVIAIIWIIWVFSIWWFSDFLKNQETNSKIAKISEFLKEKDLEIKNKENFDYEIFFEKNKNYFVTYKNNFWTENKISFKNEKIKIEKWDLEKLEELKKNEIDKIKKNIDNIEKNIDNIEKNIKELEKNIEKEEEKKIEKEKIKKSIKEEIKNKKKKKEEIQKEKNDLEKKEFLKIFIYENWKLNKILNIFKDKDKIEKNCLENNIFCEENISENKISDIVLKENFDYEIKAKNYYWKYLNNIYLKNFDNENKIILKKISDKKENWYEKNSLKITNFWWKKKIFLEDKEVEEAFIFFESQNWKTDYLLIKK